MNRRSLVLLAVLVILLGVYLWSERPGPLASIGGSDAGRIASVGRSGAAVVALATDELERAGGEFELGRDLFRYGAAPRPVPRQAVQPPQGATQPPQRQPRPQPAPAEPPKPKPPKIDIVYLGSFGYPGRRIAVFSDAEGVYNAQVGDVVKDEFILVNIGYESADLGFVGFPDTPPQRLAVGRL